MHISSHTGVHRPNLLNAAPPTAKDAKADASWVSEPVDTVASPSNYNVSEPESGSWKKAFALTLGVAGALSGMASTAQAAPPQQFPSSSSRHNLSTAMNAHKNLGFSTTYAGRGFNSGGQQKLPTTGHKTHFNTSGVASHVRSNQFRPSAPGRSVPGARYTVGSGGAYTHHKMGHGTLTVGPRGGYYSTKSWTVGPNSFLHHSTIRSGNGVIYTPGGANVTRDFGTYRLNVGANGASFSFGR